mmetsp:Transcript_69890/g.198357  ORF Transcript_69890/g.198357 Transcript_69890/m.198357 type:complete len:231 (-) Transcript_69890:3742-4434(-)
MVPNAFMLADSASGSSSARADLRMPGRASFSPPATSVVELSKKCSTSLAPNARRFASCLSFRGTTSSAKSMWSPACSTRSMTRPAAWSATSTSSGSSPSSSDTALMMGGRTSDKCLCTVCVSGTTARAARPCSCSFVQPSWPRCPSWLSTSGSTVGADSSSSFSRPLRSLSCSSASSSSKSWISTQVTTSVVARGPTDPWSSATTRLAELRTFSSSSMMACWMAGMRLAR